MDLLLVSKHYTNTTQQKTIFLQHLKCYQRNGLPSHDDRFFSQGHVPKSTILFTRCENILYVSNLHTPDVGRNSMNNWNVNMAGNLVGSLASSGMKWMFLTWILVLPPASLSLAEASKDAVMASSVAPIHPITATAAADIMLHFEKTEEHITVLRRH